MNQGVMLNAYPDSLGGNLAAEAGFLARPECRGAFRSFLYPAQPVQQQIWTAAFPWPATISTACWPMEGSLKRVGELGWI